MKAWVQPIALCKSGMMAKACNLSIGSEGKRSKGLGPSWLRRELQANLEYMTSLSQRGVRVGGALNR